MTNERSGDGVGSKERKRFLNKELVRLQAELVKWQEAVRTQGLRVVVVFEGRDAAGKGGVIKRIVEPLNPRWCRVALLGTVDYSEPAPLDLELPPRQDDADYVRPPVEAQRFVPTVY